MKKCSFIFLAAIMCFYMFMPYPKAAEKTLNQLEAEAKANRDAYNKAKNQKALSEKERASAQKEQAQIKAEIPKIEAELSQIEKDVKELQKNIEIKDKEIKKIMSYVQLSNGESAYLEYAFGASSFTDFIYRVSVAEQLSDYNDELVKGYNEDIKKLEQKQKELTIKQAELSKKQQELAVLEARLTKEIETLKEGMISKDEQYKVQLGLIQSMKNMGCSGSDTPTSCQRKNGNNLISTNGTYMPIARGYVSSNYGWRDLDGDGKKEDFHEGIDFSRSVVGDKVYSVADGQVVLLRYNRSCGNHMVYVKHNINGHSYITSYWHLASYNVHEGQMITYNTVIGYMANAGRYTGDTCSGGVHVHLNLFDNAGGAWESRVLKGGNPNKGRINPRTAMPQIPGKDVYFSHR